MKQLGKAAQLLVVAAFILFFIHMCEHGWTLPFMR